jgi:2-iminobutanoate/2-iminopropanoate deaminase
MKKEIKTELAPEAIGPYSQAIEIDGFLFTAGQIGIDPNNGELKSSVEEQAEQALKNLTAILEAAGYTSDDVVKTTIFLARIEDFPKVNEIYSRFFRKPYPARSTVAVASLPKNALVEIELIARREK